MWTKQLTSEASLTLSVSTLQGWGIARQGLLSPNPAERRKDEILTKGVTRWKANGPVESSSMVPGTLHPRAAAPLFSLNSQELTQSGVFGPFLVHITDRK